MGGKVVHMIKRRRLASFTQITLKALGACRSEPVVHQWFERLEMRSYSVQPFVDVAFKFS